MRLPSKQLQVQPEARNLPTAPGEGNEGAQSKGRQKLLCPLQNSYLKMGCERYKHGDGLRQGKVTEEDSARSSADVF